MDWRLIQMILKKVLLFKNKRSTIRKIKIKEAPLKDPTKKGIQVMSVNEFSNNYIREYPKKELGSKAMLKYWQDTEESEDSSIQEESSVVNEVQKLKRGSRYQQNAPGLFIQKLDPEADKLKKKTETEDSKSGLISPKNDLQLQRVNFLSPHSESSFTESANNLGINLNKNNLSGVKESPKLLIRKFQRSDDSYSDKSQKKNRENNGEFGLESHYGAQRKMFLRTCQNPMKVLKTQGFFKSMKDRAKNNKNSKKDGLKISTKKEKKFYKNLYDCILKGK